MRAWNWRLFLGLLAATAIGTAWAWYNYTSTGGAREISLARPLVWTIFAIPFALCIGWLLLAWARRGVALFASFCLYFFSPFIAARWESFFFSPEAADRAGHDLYFKAVMVVNILGAIGLAIWQARIPPREPEPTAVTPVAATEQSA